MNPIEQPIFFPMTMPEPLPMEDEEEESFLDFFPYLLEKIEDQEITLDDISLIEEIVVREGDFEELSGILNRLLRTTMGKHAHFFDNDAFTEEVFKEELDFIVLENEVGMNERSASNWLVLPPGEEGCLGTRGLSTCFALMGRGQLPDGSCVLYCHHYGEGKEGKEDIRAEVDLMYRSFIEYQGCVPESVELYALGGQMALPNDPTGSLKTLFKILSIAQNYPFKGLQFNEAKSNESLIAYIAKDRIVYQKEQFMKD